uniref:Nucleotide-binding alpha-beta plait domain-containing protein n=1 Tax=Tanacetum cinerariifolium TaxID=118510 RepID=A0A6L2N957_TANCI|nr:nucleotide-binding alpha-beta plait domain-containing protein [Tanacetum cinerariifolium]
MRSYWSKEDEVLKISTSNFVANFPDSFGAKDLWNTCKQYGQVVDAYIPYRRSKAGKRFGFVRFIKVFDMDRLVNNLCTVWVGRHKLQANIPRFQTEPLKRHNSLHNIDGVKKGNSGDTYNSNGVKSATNSYAHVVKGSQNSKMDSDSSPVMVLDESCLNEKDYSLCLIGKVKDLATLANLNVVVANEGSDNIKFKYMGGYWVHLASSDINTDGRVTWVEIKGISLKMWSKNTFNRVALKWGVLLDVDDREDEHFHKKGIYINTNIPKNIFESFKLIYKGKVFWVRAKEVPGWILDFVEDNDEEEDSKVGSYKKLPNGEDVNNVEDLKGDSDGEIVPDTKFEEDFPNQKGEEDSVRQGNVQSEDPFNIHELLNHKRPVIEKNSNSTKSLKYPPGYTPTGNHFKKSEVPKSGTSILHLIDDLVKVRETMGASVGNSGRILYVWDPNMFKKTNSTVSDYFVMVRGDWMPNGKKLLIISVYAPQELYEKKMLWDYLSLVMSYWEGEVVIMDDFNEVHNKSERFGTLFNRHGADIFNRFISNAGLEEVPLEGCSFTWCHRSATKMSKLDHSWKDAPIIESNALVRMMKKLKYLKEKIRMWNKLNKEKLHKSKRSLLAELADCNAIIDKGEGKNNVVNRRTEVVKLLQEVEKKNSLEAARKAKIKWAIKGTWIDFPSLVKSKFMSHFKNRFEQPNSNRLHMNMHFSNTLSSVQVADLECQVYKEEIKTVVWDCGIDKSPGPDRFTFGFYRRYWKLIENDVVDARKLKTLSIGGRLTLLKSMLGSMPIYHISLFKVPKKVLHRMESMRSHFFNGAELSSKKSVWVKWKHALASKDKVGLGSSLWARVIKALHGYDDKIGQKVKSCYPSLWLDIIHEVELFKSRGIDLVSLIHSKLGNGANTSFWEVAWRGGSPSGCFVHRPPGGGFELQQFEHMKEKVEGCILADIMDRWFWALEGSGTDLAKFTKKQSKPNKIEHEIVKNAQKPDLRTFFIARTVAIQIELSDQLSRVHSTFHISNLKKCLPDKTLGIPLDEIQIIDKLHFVEEPVEIMDREVKGLEQNRIHYVKVRWNSRRGSELTREREDRFQKKYPHLIAIFAPSSNAPT